MKLEIPIKNQVWTPNYNGKYWGDIVSAFRADLLTERGSVMRGMPALAPHTTNDDTTDMGLPSDIVEFDGYYWTFSTKVLRTNAWSTKFSVDTLTNSPTDLSDADGIVYQDALIVSRPTDLARLTSSTGSWDASWWVTTLGKSALQNVSHPLAVMGSHLFIGDKNNMHDIFGGDTVYLNRYTVPDTENATIEWIETTSDYVYLGIKFTEREHTYMIVEFDPISETSKEIYLEQDARGFILNDTFYLILEDGSIKVRQPTRYRLNPVFNKVAQFPTGGGNNVITLPHRNGWTTYRGKPFFFIKENTLPYNPAGIYILDTDIGAVYHYTGIGCEKTYGFPSLESSTFLYYSSDDNKWFTGVEYYKPGIGYKTGVFSFLAIPGTTLALNSSWIELPRMLSSELDEIWQNVIIGKSALTEDNTIVTIEYKIIDGGPYGEWSGTWQADNKFSYSSTPDNLEVGNAVMIIKGDGAGLIAHITDIDTTASSITIDTSISGASGDMTFWIDTYKKIDSITFQNGYEMRSFPNSPLINPWIQIRLIINQQGISKVLVQHKPNNILE